MGRFCIFTKVGLFIIIILLLHVGNSDGQHEDARNNDGSLRRIRKFSGRRPNEKFLKSAILKNLVLDDLENKTLGNSTNSSAEKRTIIDSEASISEDFVVNASYNVIYSDLVSKDRSFTFRYPALQKDNDVGAVRVWVYSENSTQNYPILFVVEEPRGILSWQVPLSIESENTNYFYNNVSRTLCPYGRTTEEYNIEISTFSKRAVHFTIYAQPQPLDIELSEVINTSVGPSEPVYFRFTMPSGVDSVVVRLNSNDDLCMIFSVQPATCPVFDLVTSVELRGRHQTVTRKGSITLQRDSHTNNTTYFIVLVATPSDFNCKNEESIVPAANFTIERLKNVTLEIEQSISRSEFILAVLAAGLWYLGFYIMAFVIIAIYNCIQKRKAHTRGTPTPPPEPSEHDALTTANTDGENPDSEDMPDLIHRVPSHGTQRCLHQRSRSQPEMLSSYHSQSSSSHNLLDPVPTLENVSSSASLSSIDETDVDMLRDADKDKDIIRSKTFLYLNDLSRKSRKTLNKAINLYPWNLITLAVFYALPVIQLVLTYQKVLNRTGDEDTCYYNFDCAHPLVLPYPKFRLTTFNNVYSNIGYVSLGILFLLIVYRRDHLHRIEMKQSPHLVKHYGIPQHFGLFYSMGIALTMMGVLSACYHICPSYNNFQFDTSFMYVLSWILMLRIYQTRHPDINPHAHTAFFVLALAIFFVVVGVVYGTVYFWVVFVLVYCTFYLLVSVHVYYMGRYKLNFGLFRRVYNMWRVERSSCIKPIYVDRFILLVIGNAVNWFFAIFGCVMKPPDFASYMLSIFLINLMMYFAFYIVMKMRSGERLLLIPVIFTLIAVVLWGFSFFFFMKHVTSWQVTPAVSRERNRPCMLLDFYDSHDVWHFLSSMSMFFSFNMLLTLDDDLIEVPRDAIRVF